MNALIRLIPLALLAFLAACTSQVEAPVKVTEGAVVCLVGRQAYTNVDPTICPGARPDTVVVECAGPADAKQLATYAVDVDCSPGAGVPNSYCCVPKAPCCVELEPIAPEPPSVTP